MASPFDKANKEDKKRVADMAEEQYPEASNDDWFNLNRHTILLYGQPKVGKTWAYCSIIEQAVDNGNNVYVINTDGGLASTLKAYFGKGYKDYAESIDYTFCSKTMQAINATKRIVANAEAGDWVIVDLMSDFWSMAQDEFLESTGMDPDEYIKLASNNQKKFGLFEGSKWNYIKKLDNAITDVLPKKGQYNVLAVCGAKDITPEKKIAGIKKHEFEDIGFKPEGQRSLPHRFETIVFIGGQNKKFFRVAGHRGKNVNSDITYYGRNFWEKFSEKISEVDEE